MILTAGECAFRTLRPRARASNQRQRNSNERSYAQPGNHSRSRPVGLTTPRNLSRSSSNEVRATAMVRGRVVRMIASRSRYPGRLPGRRIPASRVAGPRTPFQTSRATWRKTWRVEVRSAEPGDAGAIAEVHVRAWQVAYQGMIPDAHLDGLSVSRRSDNWRVIIAEFDYPRRGAFVAVDASKVLGFVHFGPSRDADAGPDVGELTVIYVRPDRWGEGIGRRLIQRAVQSLAEAGFSSATLWVLDANERARRFYEEAGWTTDGATKNDEREDLRCTSCDTRPHCALGDRRRDRTRV